MPGFNGTGPAGGGPMTGRGRGYCIRAVEQGLVFGRELDVLWERADYLEEARKKTSEQIDGLEKKDRD